MYRKDFLPIRLPYNFFRTESGSWFFWILGPGPIRCILFLGCSRGFFMVSSALRHPDSTSLFHHYIGMQYTIPQQGIPPLHRVNDIKHSLPVEGGWLRPAARERSSPVLDGAILVRTWTCTTYIHIHPQYKSFAELFQQRPFPRSPVPPRSPRNTIKHPSTCERSRRRGA